jgi:hypothetical protein
VHTVVDAAAGEIFSAQLLCDAGDLPLSGGYLVSPDGARPYPSVDPGDVEIWVDRYFVPSPFQHGWQVDGRNTSPSAQDVLVRALCADIERNTVARLRLSASDKRHE